MPLSPGFKLGPYEILSPLGTGGMGEVYRARDTRGWPTQRALINLRSPQFPQQDTVLGGASFREFLRKGASLPFSTIHPAHSIAVVFSCL